MSHAATRSVLICLTLIASLLLPRIPAVSAAESRPAAGEVGSEEGVVHAQSPAESSTKGQPANSGFFDRLRNWVGQGTGQEEKEAKPAQRTVNRDEYVPAKTTLTSNDLSIQINKILLPGDAGYFVPNNAWAEYQITVVNNSKGILTLGKSFIVSEQGALLSAGFESPDQLFKPVNIANELEGIERSAQLSTAVSVGAGVGTGLLAAAALSPVLAIAGAIFSPFAGSALMGNGSASSAQSKIAVVQELQKRSFQTARLDKGGTASGSAFYPLVKNPSALVVNYKIGSTEYEERYALR